VTRFAKSHRTFISQSLFGQKAIDRFALESRHRANRILRHGRCFRSPAEAGLEVARVLLVVHDHRNRLFISDLAFTRDDPVTYADPNEHSNSVRPAASASRASPTGFGKCCQKVPDIARKNVQPGREYASLGFSTSPAKISRLVFHVATLRDSIESS